MFDRITQIERRFKRISENLRPFDLQYLDEDVELTEEDLLGELTGRGQATRFLGYYSRGGITRALEAYGIYALLRERGYEDPQLEWELTDMASHRLRIYDGPDRGPANLLVDFAAHIGSARNASSVGCNEPLPDRIELLVIDWLMLQDPRRPSGREDLLPGQRHPGLGIGKEIGVLIGRIAHRLKLDGCMATPAWYHNALAYSSRYSFLAPAVEGRFRALRRDTAHLPLLKVAWAVEWGCLQIVDAPPAAGGGAENARPRPVTWEGRCQVWAFAPALVAHFRNPAYKGVRDAVRDSTRFVIDEACFQKAFAQHARAGGLDDSGIEPGSEQ